MVQDVTPVPSYPVPMRDQHRSKQDLCAEITALRKQVSDLKEERRARQRVEDALRHGEEQLRLLADSMPGAVCLFRPDGVPMVANTRFARLLGYESSAELQRIGEVLGVFAPDDLERVRNAVAEKPGAVPEVRLRSKDGRREAYAVIAALRQDPEGIAVLIIDRPPLSRQIPSRPELNAARADGMRSA